MLKPENLLNSEPVMTEEKYIPGFENVYKINKNGTVTRELYGKRKEMTKYINKKGYVVVSLSGSNGQRPYLVHRLLAKTFIENPKELPCVNHKDGNKSNNSLENLEWCTYSENIYHAFRTGLRPNSSGEKHHNAVKVFCVEAEVAFGSMADAARWCGGSYKSMWRACSGKRKTYMGYTWKYI